MSMCNDICVWLAVKQRPRENYYITFNNVVYTPVLTLCFSLTENLHCVGYINFEDICEDSRFKITYYLIREIKTWLNINHATVRNNTYCIF